MTDQKLDIIKKNWIDIRTTFVTYALHTTILSIAIGSILYALEASAVLSLMTPIIASILAGISSAIIAGLLITASIAWISAALTESEKNETQILMLRHHEQITRNSKEITTILNCNRYKNNSPTQSLTQQILVMQGKIEQASACVHSSLTTATNETSAILSCRYGLFHTNPSSEHGPAFDAISAVAETNH